MKVSLQRRDKVRAPLIARRHAKACARKYLLYKTNKVDQLESRLADQAEPGDEFRLTSPRRLSIRNPTQRPLVLQFLARLGKTALSRGLAVKVDFSALEYVEPTAALLVFAEIDRIARLLGASNTLSAVLPTQRRYRQLLQQLGILDRLNASIQLPAKADLPDNVRYWDTATGVSVDEEAGSFLDGLEGRLAPSLSEGVWKALSEALVNSVQHAYLQPRGDGLPELDRNRWWMLTQERDGQLTVAVCDLGIGIRRSLPLRWSGLTLGQILRDIRTPEKDVAAIRASLVIGATRTGEVNRGRGLPQIWNGMKREDVGGIAIMSGKGFLSYSADQGTEHEFQFADSILGTLIMWTVELRGPDPK